MQKIKLQSLMSLPHPIMHSSRCCPFLLIPWNKTFYHPFIWPKPAKQTLQVYNIFIFLIISIYPTYSINIIIRILLILLEPNFFVFTFFPWFKPMRHKFFQLASPNICFLLWLQIMISRNNK